MCQGLKSRLRRRPCHLCLHLFRAEEEFLGALASKAVGTRARWVVFRNDDHSTSPTTLRRKSRAKANSENTSDLSRPPSRPGGGGTPGAPGIPGIPGIAFLGSLPRIYRKFLLRANCLRPARSARSNGVLDSRLFIKENRT